MKRREKKIIRDYRLTIQETYSISPYNNRKLGMIFNINENEDIKKQMVKAKLQLNVLNDRLTEIDDLINSILKDENRIDSYNKAIVTSLEKDSLKIEKYQIELRKMEQRLLKNKLKLQELEVDNIYEIELLFKKKGGIMASYNNN